MTWLYSDGGKGSGGSALEGKAWQQDSDIEYTYDEVGLESCFDKYISYYLFLNIAPSCFE